jgi:tRNA(Ile)-lysidine synthetase-like protein
LHRHSLIEKTEAAFESLGVPRTAKLLIGVSGGPDSLALLHVLVQLRDAHSIGEVVVAHVNHLLRQEASDNDQAVVEQYAKVWNIPIEITRADTLAIADKTSKGIEETARNIRYDYFEKVAAQHSCDYVITAHTANDQAETVIMNMVRGAGVRGLAGIPAKRTLGSVYVIRPWLGVTREEIEKYITEHGLSPERDESNQSLTYQRNRVRHGVIPALAEAYPDRSPVTAIATLATRMRELSTLLDRLTEEKIEMLRENGGLSLAGLKNVKGFLLHAVVEAWINSNFPLLFKSAPGQSYRLSADEARRIERFLTSDAMAIELRRGLRLRKSGKILRLSRAARPIA